MMCEIACLMDAVSGKDPVRTDLVLVGKSAKDYDAEQTNHCK